MKSENPADVLGTSGVLFLGGILVLFVYVTSLASNEIFNLSIKLTLFSVFILFLILILSFIIDKTSISLFLINNEIESIIKISSYFIENSLSLNKLSNFSTNFITILLINYLLITLIVVVKTRKNAVVEYLDCQIPVTQLMGPKGNGDMQAAKRY